MSGSRYTAKNVIKVFASSHISRFPSSSVAKSSMKKLCFIVTASTFTSLFLFQNYFNFRISTRRDGSQDDLIELLANVSATAPPAEINQSCRAESLTEIEDMVCDDKANNPGLEGPRLSEPRKVVMMILFGFEVDTLEIALREQLDIVDKMFIVESTVTHKGTEKPLMWPKIMKQDRFSFVNRSKIEHVVYYTESRHDVDIWFYEDGQTMAGVAAVKRWSSESGNLAHDDVFISADVDEVMSRDALHRLKHCPLPAPVISGALVMPFGNLNMAFRSDYPVLGRDHSYAEPTIYRWEGIMTGMFDGRRGVMGLRMFPNITNMKHYIQGGIHMTANSFVPTTLLKDLTATEYVGALDLETLEEMTLEDFNSLQDYNYNLNYSETFKKRWDTIETVTDVESFVPWFLKCNPQRYPYWSGHPDPRNKFLVNYLKEFFSW